MKIPTSVWLLGIGGIGLLGYYLFKKKEFPFNEGSIFNELKQDLSNLGPSAGGGGAPMMPPRGGGPPSMPTGDDGGVIPGTVQSNPSAVDYSLYQNYLQGLKTAFPDYVPNISSTTGQVIAGDPNLFQNNNINGPPIQPYPGGAVMPPYTQQMYPYYKAPIPGRPPMGPMLPPPRPGPMGPPPWNDPWFEYDTDKYGRRRRKWHKPKPTASTPPRRCKIQVGSICIGYDNSVSMGNGLNIGGSSGSSSGSNNNVSGGNGISVGGLFQGGSLGNLFGSGSGGSSNNLQNNYGVGTSANPQVIQGQVNNILNDVFAKVGISR